MKRSERSIQSMEAASEAKQSWVQHVRLVEQVETETTAESRKLESLRAKNRVRKLLSLLSSSGLRLNLTMTDSEGLLREGREWVANMMQPCLQIRREKWGKVSWECLVDYGMHEAVVKVGNAKWSSPSEARRDLEVAGLRWGRVGKWEDMVFKRCRTRNLLTLTSEVVLSVRVDEHLKSLLIGVKQVSHGEDPPIISLPDEDRRREKGLRPFRTLTEWNRGQE